MSIGNMMKNRWNNIKLVEKIMSKNPGVILLEKNIKKKYL